MIDSYMQFKSFLMNGKASHVRLIAKLTVSFFPGLYNRESQPLGNLLFSLQLAYHNEIITLVFSPKAETARSCR